MKYLHMKNSALASDRERLEAIFNRDSRQVKPLKFLLRINKILQLLTKAFLGSNELRVWQTYDRYGNNWWHAYDPLTGRCNCVESEAEMRVWIEKCYYR